MTIETKPQEPAINLENIPKVEYEKAVKEKDSAINQLKTALNERELKLLDPEYLEFLEQKKLKVTPVKESTQPTELKDVLARVDALTSTITNLQNYISDREAAQELAETKARHSDWNEVEADIKEYYRAHPNSVNTYEEVYKLVKSDKAPVEKKEEKEKKKPPQSEKPSSNPPPETFKKAEFKTEAEANAAVIASLRSKYPDLGDTI